MLCMAIRVVEFSNGGWGTKLERFLPKNQHNQRKLLKFEDWVNGEVSITGRLLKNLSSIVPPARKLRYLFCHIAQLLSE